MKILNLLCFIYFINFCVAQEYDYQWLVLDGVGKFGLDGYGLNNYMYNVNNNGINISGIVYPEMDYSTPPKQKSNRFFAILANGQYALTDKFYTPGSFIDRVNGNEYNLSFSSPVKYLYLTNRYEEDDPPPRVKVGMIGNNNNNLIINNNPGPGIKIGFNHDLVKGDDATIIISSDKEILNCSLSYNGPLSDFSFIPNKIFNGKNFLYGPTMSNNNLDIVFTNKKSVTFDVGHGNTFINFNVNYTHPLNSGRNLTMNLECPNLPSINTTEKISADPHDPNYVELVGVWEESNGKKYAKYKISCFNDSPLAGVDSLKFNFILPTKAISSTIKFTKDFIGASNRCNKQNQITINNNEITYRFKAGLSTFPSSAYSIANTHIGSLEFCVELNGNTNLAFDDLKIISPISYFNVDPYPITTFKDKKILRDKQWTRKKMKKSCNCDNMIIPNN